MVLASKHETQWTDEAPQTNAKNACVCATPGHGTKPAAGRGRRATGILPAPEHGQDAHGTTGLADFNSDNSGFGYDALGRRISLTRPNGVGTSYSYDTLSRLLSVLHNGGALPGSTGYTYDAAGNRTSKTAVQEASPNPVSVLSQYSYDNIYELTQAVVNGSLTEAYSYDAVGNRLTSAGPTTYNYNSSNELTTDSAATFTYDGNGNTTTKTTSAGTTNYTWDLENRLMQVTLPGTGGTVYLNYDPFGRRIRKVFGSATTIYAYDGGNVIQQLNGAGSLVAEYTQGAGIDEPLATTGSGGTYFYHADALGSITSLTSPAGNLATSYVYDSFGNLTASTGIITNPFQYTAREFDSESSLYYYRARYYDPPNGRWMSEDPDDFVSDVNFYRYVYNRPLDLIDPSGRRGKKPHPPSPAPNPNAAFYICCQGGDFGVCDGPLARPSSFDNPIFNNWKLKCEKEHEQQHQEDFRSGMFSYAINPSSCVGQRNNVSVRVNLAYQSRVECRGYQRQLQCLMKMESLMTPEINHVKDQLKQFNCDCGK